MNTTKINQRCKPYSKKRTTQDIVNIFKNIHGDKYDYSKVEYKKAREKVCIICPEHGEFWQSPDTHQKGVGCPKCAGKNITTEEFITKLKNIHGDKYDYSKVEYKNNRGKVIIICPEHGEVLMAVSSLLRKGRRCCKYCGAMKVYNGKDFIKEAIKKHGDKYDYSQVFYKTCYDPVKIICPDHGVFCQKPIKHLQGHKCPHCKESKLETEIRVLLDNHNIKYEYEKTFKWLKTNKGGQQTLDFYLPDYKLAIECQGGQHYFNVNIFTQNLKEIENLDAVKLAKCKENNIKILYFTNKEYEKYDPLAFTDKEKLLEEIKKYPPNIFVVS